MDEQPLDILPVRQQQIKILYPGWQLRAFYCLTRKIISLYSQIKVNVLIETFHGSTWSEHQYHMEGMDMPMMMPGQGRSELTGSLNKWKASSRGMPQVEFGTRIDGMALAYPSSRAFQPPTSTKPQQGHRRVRQEWNITCQPGEGIM